VADTAKDNRTVLDRAENGLREAIATARASGLSREEAVRILTEVYADSEA
jgi:DNA-binding transcriptional regulator YhcF (GntR family)